MQIRIPNMFAVAVACVTVFAATRSHAADPIPSWNDTSAKKAIVEFVGKVTKVSDAYVGVEIAEGTEIVVQKAAVTTILPKGTIKSL